MIQSGAHVIKHSFVSLQKKIDSENQVPKNSIIIGFHGGGFKNVARDNLVEVDILPFLYLHNNCHYQHSSSVNVSLCTVVFKFNVLNPKLCVNASHA